MQNCCAVLWRALTLKDLTDFLHATITVKTFFFFFKNEAK